MKIYEGQGLLFRQVNKGTNKTGSKDNDFQKLMEEIGSRTESPVATSSKGEAGPLPGGIQILNGIERILGQDKTPTEMSIIDELEETLDLVDFYSARLGDSSIPASGLDPLISHLEERIEGLRSMESDTDTPEGLRSVISEMVVTIGGEISKFKRGDYQ